MALLASPRPIESTSRIACPMMIDFRPDPVSRLRGRVFSFTSPRLCPVFML